MVKKELEKFYRKEKRIIRFLLITGIVVFLLLMSFLFWSVKEAHQAIDLSDEVVVRPAAATSPSDSDADLASLVDYCLSDESGDSMSAIGQEYEIGALQYKVETWIYLSEKYHFDGCICDRDDQIKLFKLAVRGGDGFHWTCYQKFYDLQRDYN